MRKVNPTERRKRGEELLELVRLAGLGRRMPRQLSGGQQQRVALARALASKPEVLLLDEPLGALDAKIRIELRRSLRAIQQQLGIATILVTHDQEEAFDLADRIGVMNYGRLVEASSPAQLYQQPQTEFVASFLGSANLLVGEAESGQIRLGNVSIPYSGDAQPAQAGARVQVLFRPEEIALAPAPAELDCPMLGIGEVEEINYAGAYERLRLRLPALPGVRPIAPPVPYGSRAIRVEVTHTPDQSARLPLQLGMRAHVGVRRLHALAHPGMNFLILTDGGLRAQAAVALGGQLARLAHARVTLMGFGQPEARLNEHLAQARKQLGSGAAAVRLETWQGIAMPAKPCGTRQNNNRTTSSFGIQQEQAATTLGANAWQTFWRITVPALRWGFIYGMTLTFARALGEFGAVLVIGGGVQGRTETATLFIYHTLDERQYAGAYGAALVLGIFSLLLVLGSDYLHRRAVH